MSRFKKKQDDDGPGMSTASLPDIVFMILFFFMVTTSMKEVEPLVRNELPTASEITKLEDKALVGYIYIGPPTETQLGDQPRLQLNDAFAQPEDIGPFWEEKKTTIDEQLHPKLITSFKVDIKTKMGIVTDLKQELRKIQMLKINYSTYTSSAK